ncbi:MAG: FkbM family methyltransferase [bacterium]
MKRILRIGRSIWRRLYGASSAFGRGLVGNEYASRSYSQYGEDMVLRAVFARYPATYPGFYVDIGAHHPLRFSNTRFFYERGWSGICVDPLPCAAKLFARLRPRDIFLQAGVAAREGEMTYYMFDEPAFNTFTEQIAKENAERVKNQQRIKVLPLCRIIGEHLPSGRMIDFLSIDVEGLDLEVLRSNDWAHYRPCIVLIEETAASTLEGVENLAVTSFMKQQDYKAILRTPSGLFFVDGRLTTYEGGCYLNFFVELH